MDSGREFLVRVKVLPVFFLALVCIFSNGCAKETRQYRIGIICGLDVFAEIADGFKAEMRMLGYREGRDVVYNLQRFHLDPAGERKAVKQFVADKVDLILAFPTRAALAAKEAVRGTDIPVIFAAAAVEKTGLIRELHSPGDNITGVRFPGPESTGKRLETLKELVPSAKRIYLAYNPDYPAIHDVVESLRMAADPVGIALVEEHIRSLSDLNAAIARRAALSDPGIDAILMLPEVTATSSGGFAVIAEFAGRYKIPIAGSAAFTAEKGALFSLFPDNREMGKMAAVLGDKILKGAPAGTLLVVTPPPRLRLNYRLAREMGLTVPDGLMNRADEIIR